MSDTRPVDDLPTSEEVARLKQAEDTSTTTDAPDPTGGTDKQMAAKQAANQLGDQDAVNLAAAYRYPADAEVPTAANVRRYPELFSQEVIDSFNDFEDMTDEQRDEHNKAVEAHWANRGGVAGATGDTNAFDTTPPADEPISTDATQEQPTGTSQTSTSFTSS